MPAIPAPVHTEDEVRAYFCEVVLPTKEVWVAEKGGAVVALLVLGDEWIDQLYVDPEFVGDGLRLEPHRCGEGDAAGRAQALDVHGQHSRYAFL